LTRGERITSLIRKKGTSPKGGRKRLIIVTEIDNGLKQNLAYSLPRVHKMINEIDSPVTEEQAFENRMSFMNRLSFLNPQDRMLVMYAYDTAKYAHRDQVRESGERYFEHPREVALIGIDELGIKNPNVIENLLIHDVFEDSSLLSNAAFGTYEENKFEAMFRMSRSFNIKVARDVISVSKPKGTDIAGLSKQEVESMYRGIVSQGSIESTLVKACDRLHNLRTHGECDIDKQMRKVKETKDFYFPLFRRLLRKYPQEYSYLMTEMNKAILALNLPVS
jgi:(p)ppGpp synthase/HD superfamily hydrolase